VLRGSAVDGRWGVERVQATRLDLLGTGQQLRGGEIQTRREASEAGVAGVTLAGLDVGDPALVQVSVVGELLLGEIKLAAAGLDGQAEGVLEGWGCGHAASVAACQRWSNDIAVDLCLTFR
jgi:hypothetical protein